MIANNFENLSNKTWLRIEEFQDFLDTKTKRGQSTAENFRIKSQNSSTPNKFVNKNFRMRPKSGNIASVPNPKPSQHSQNPEKPTLNLNSAKTCKNIENPDPFLSMPSATPTYQSMKEIQAFIKNSSLFTKFKHDLQDLFDLSRNSDCDFKYTQSTNLYFALREEVESELNIKVDNVENDLEKIIARSLNYSKEFVKDVKVKGDKNSGIIAEYLIRFHLKVIDRTYQVLKRTVENLEKSNLDTLENWKDTRKDDASRAKETFELKFAQVQDELRKALEKNDELKGVIKGLRLELMEKNKEIINLTEVDTGVPAMQSLEHLLKSLNMVISDTKDQRKLKSRMIEDFQQFFESVEKVNRPLACVSSESQTDWSIPKPKIPVPLLPKPIISTNILYTLDPVESEHKLNSLKPKIIESLLSLSHQKPFLYTLSENIFEFFQKRPDKINALFQAVQQIAVGNENWNILSSYLLGLNKDLPKIVEKGLCNILGVFSDHLNLDKCEMSLPAEEFFNIIQKSFKNFPKFQHWVLTKATIYTEPNFEGKVRDSFSVFCMRFAVAFEKTKENLKQSLEKFSKVKTGLVSFDIFKKFLSKKLKFLYFIEELYQVWEHAQPDLYNVVTLHRLIQDLNFTFNTQRVKKSSVSILDFLQVSCEYFIEELEIHNKNMKKVRTCEDPESLSTFFTKHSIQFSPDQVPLILTRLTLQEPLLLLSSEHNLYPTDLVSLSEIKQKVKKKPKKTVNFN